MHPRILVALLLTASAALAADWPTWRGPGNLGVSSETGLLKTWPAAGPKLVYTSKVAGRGLAGLAVVGGVVYTMGEFDGVEYVVAIDKAGKEAWKSKIGPVHDWKDNSWSRGPNATPVVDGDHVFGLGSKGFLVCVEKNGGKNKWTLDIGTKLNGDVNDVGGGIEKFGWGYSWSPVVDGDQLIIAPGGEKGLIAGLDKKTGEVKWRSKGVTVRATYSSPVLATILGVKQVLYVHQEGLVSVSAKDGEKLWEYKPEAAYSDVVCSQPIVKDDKVFFSVGYSGGAKLLEIAKKGAGYEAKPVWEEKVISNKQSGVTLVGDYLYGAHEDRNWQAISFAKGKPAEGSKWGARLKTVKAGGFVAADGRLYAVTEDDDGPNVVMIEASPTAYKVVSSFALPEVSKLRKSATKLWTYPALSDGKLYIRDQEIVWCYEVK